MKGLLAILFLAAQAQAATLYVSLTGSHDTNAPAFSTWEAAATNIQSAIDAASAGDTVRVAPGTYPAAVTINKNSLTVQGGNGTLWDADRTFIDLQGAANSKGVTFSDATNSTLRGFTVTGARPTYGAGAVFMDVNSTGCVIESCVVRGNQSAEDYTSGIRSLGSSSEARNCIVVGNHAIYGGVSAATYLGSDGFFTIQNCIVEANANYQAYLQVAGRITAINCVLGNAHSTTHAGGNVTNNTTNSVCRVLDIAPASEGVGTNLVWAGVAAYIPRIGSLAQGAGVGYAGIDAAKSGDGGPALWPIGAGFLGRDYSTNANHVVPVGGVTASTDSPFVGGGSAVFDGTSGYIDLGRNYNQYLNGAPAITLEAWVNTGRTNLQDLIQGHTQLNGYYGWVLMAENGTIGIGGRSTGNETFQGHLAAPAPTGSWVHAAGVIDYANGQLSMYIDGVLATNASASWGRTNFLGTVPSLGANIGAGNVFNSKTRQRYFAGNLFESRIWNVARTPEEIAANYTNRLVGNEAGLVGYWRLDEPEMPITTGPFNLRNPTLQPTFMEAF